MTMKVNCHHSLERPCLDFVFAHIQFTIRHQAMVSLGNPLALNLHFRHISPEITTFLLSLQLGKLSNSC